MKKLVWLGVPALTMGLLVAVSAGDSGGPEKKWVLTDEQFTRLVAAEVKFMNGAFGKDGDKASTRKIQASAALLIAYAEQSAHADRQVAKTNAEMVFQLAGAGSWKAAKQYADLLYPKIIAGKATAEPKSKAGRTYKHYMHFFTSERIGGHGVENELAELFEAKKKLTDANFARLDELGLKMAVIAQAAEPYAPDKDVGAQTRKAWLAVMDDMRKASLSLSEASAAKNEANVWQALKALDLSCTVCHEVFR